MPFLCLSCATLPPVDWATIDREELLRRSGQDPMVRWVTGPDVLAVASDDGWAWVDRWRPGGHPGGAAIVREGAAPHAESDALAALVALATDRGTAIEWFSTAPGRALVAPPGLTVSGPGRWAFMATASTAGLPAGPPGLLELDDTIDAEEIEAFGRSHNAAFEGFPGRGLATLWLGTRDGHGLRSVGALHSLGTGAPHLAGIVVRPDLRSQGHGAALTAELTRRAVTRHGISTLGVYSDNVVAIRLYERLGYAVARHLQTRSVSGGPVGPDLG